MESILVVSFCTGASSVIFFGFLASAEVIKKIADNDKIRIFFIFVVNN